jgi:hypothetical protein
MINSPTTRMPVVFVAMALALLSMEARSAIICRWVDDGGRTHASDVVPEKYKDSATCSDAPQHELSPLQQEESDNRKAEAQNRKRLEWAQPPATAASSEGAAAASVAQPGEKGAKRPTEVITDSTDCPTRWRIYDESAACFAPYRTARGAIKPEGFDRCIEIPNPEPQCGPRRD